MSVVGQTIGVSTRLTPNRLEVNGYWESVRTSTPYNAGEQEYPSVDRPFQHAHIRPTQGQFQSQQNLWICLLVGSVASPTGGGWGITQKKHAGL